MPSPLLQTPNPESVAPCLSWDKVCDLLGGSDWSTIPEPVRSLPPFRTKFSSGRQFLFQDEPGRLPLEQLWLKLSGFASLCRRVAEFYRLYQRPYLSLDPAHITVRVSDHSFTWLPARWLFAVELDDAKGAQSLVHETMPKAMARDIFVPSGDLDANYAAPVMRQWPLGRELPVTVLLRSIERIPDDTDEQLSRGLIRAHVFSEAVSLADCSEQDAFYLGLRLPGSGTALVPLWARRVEAAERGLIVSGVTDPIPNATWAQLERAEQQVFSGAQAKVYRAFHRASDLYSLGMLLFRALLVQQSQSLDQVQQQIAGVLGRLEPLVQGLNPDDHWTRFTRVTGRLKERGEVFQPPSGSIPESVWYDALICGLRLASGIRGFSFCGSEGSTDHTRLPEALQGAMCAAECVAEQARVELFDVAARHRDLMRVCDLALAERM